MGRKAKLGMCWKDWAGRAKAKVLLRRVFSAAEFRWTIAESLPSHHSEFQSAVRCLTAWHAFTLEQSAQRQEEVRTGAADVYNRARLLTKAFQVLRCPVDVSQAQKAELSFRRKLLWAWRKWTVKKRESPIAALQKKVQEESGCRSVGEYCRRRVLRSVLRIWKRVLVEKRERSEAFWAAGLQRRALKAWCCSGDEKRERVAIQIRKWKTERKKSGLQLWRERVLERKEQQRKVQIGRLRRDRRLKRTGVAAWKAYRRDRLLKQANGIVAQRHAASLLRSGAFKRWRWRLEWKQLKLETARYHERRLKKLTWRALIRHTRESKIVRALTNGTSTRGSLKALGSARNSPRGATSPAIKSGKRSPLRSVKRPNSIVTHRSERSPTQSVQESHRGTTILLQKEMARSSLRSTRGSSERATKVAGGQVEMSPKASPRFGLTKSRLGAKEENGKRVQRAGELLLGCGSGKSRVEESQRKEMGSTKSRSSSQEAATRVEIDLPESPCSDSLQSKNVTPRDTLLEFIREREEVETEKGLSIETRGDPQMQEAPKDSRAELLTEESACRTETIGIDQNRAHETATLLLSSSEGEEESCAAQIRASDVAGLRSADSPKMHEAHSCLSSEQLQRESLEEPRPRLAEEAESRTESNAKMEDRGRNGVPTEDKRAEEGRRRSRARDESSQEGKSTFEGRRDEGQATRQRESRGTGRALRKSSWWKEDSGGREMEFESASNREQANTEGTAVQKRVRRSAVENGRRRLPTVERAQKTSETRSRRKSASDASTLHKAKEGAPKTRAHVPKGSEVSPQRLAGGISPWAVEDGMWSPEGVTFPEVASPSLPFEVLSKEPSELFSVALAESPSESEQEPVVLGRLVPSMLQTRQAEAPRDRKAAAEAWKQVGRLPGESVCLSTEAERRSLQQSEGESLEAGKLSDVQQQDTAENNRKSGENEIREAVETESAHEREEETLTGTSGVGTNQAVGTKRENEGEKNALSGGSGLKVKESWAEGESEAAPEMVTTAESVAGEGSPEVRQHDVIEESTLEAAERGAQQVEGETDGEEGWTGEGRDSHKQEAATRSGQQATRGGEEAASTAENESDRATRDGEKSTRTTGIIGAEATRNGEEAAGKRVEEKESAGIVLQQDKSGKSEEPESIGRSERGGEKFPLWGGSDETSDLAQAKSTVDISQILSGAKERPAPAGRGCTSTGARVSYKRQGVSVRETAPLDTRARMEDLSEYASRGEAAFLLHTPGVYQEHTRLEDDGSGLLLDVCEAASSLQEDADAMQSSAGATERVALGRERQSAVKWPPGRLPRRTSAMDRAQKDNALNRTRHASLVHWPPLHCEGSGPQSAKPKSLFAGDDSAERSGCERFSVKENGAKAKVRRASAPSTVLETVGAGLGDAELVRGFRVVEPECLLGPKHWTANEVDMLS